MTIFVMMLFASLYLTSFCSSDGQKTVKAKSDNDMLTNIYQKDKNTEIEISKRIFLYDEPVEGEYGNGWFAYKLDNDELLLCSEGKTNKIRAIIQFNCENDKYVLLAISNFGDNITENEFKDIVPDVVIDLSRKIMCQ